jgi:hypothetical protein
MAPRFRPVLYIWCGTMRGWHIRAMFGLVFAVLLIVGVVVSVANASIVTSESATVSTNYAIHCQTHRHCSPTDSARIGQMDCIAVCAAPALLAESCSSTFVVTPSRQILPRATLLLGSISPPDPYPPRRSSVI